MKQLKVLNSYRESGSPGITHYLRIGKHTVFVEVYEWAPGQYTLEWDDRRFCKSVGILKEYFSKTFDYLQDAVVAASRLYDALRNAPDEGWWYNHSCGYFFFSIGGPAMYNDGMFGDWSKPCCNPFNHDVITWR